ncbi:MAG TPA: MBL fold metallo-hydrolase [Acidimicrobiia bacterium]|jgi:glyoxylase-like metal-dependent hydrolase (beta-lactamase superfamily II)
MGDTTFTEVADGVWAYLPPDGTWGYSNAGLVAGDGGSLLVDTLFDLALTRAMLDRMRTVTDSSPIGTVVNTHANGDHCYGNQLMRDRRIVASVASAREMDEVPPAMLHALMQLDLGEDANRYVAGAFGPFRFDDIEPTPPTETFTGALTLQAGDRGVELTEVGPAHTAGDVVAWVPDARVVFAGDILFIDSTPIVWAGPVENWLAACHRIGELEPAVVVPGHGPLTDLDGVARVAGYLEWVRDEARARFADGMDVVDAAWDLELGPYADWGEPERVVVNVDAVYAELDPGHKRLDALQSFAAMGRYRASH